MKRLLSVGRLLFGSSMAVFGIQHLIDFVERTGLGPPWTPAPKLLLAVLGIALAVAGAGIMAKKQLRCAAILAGMICLVRATIVYAPRIVADWRQPGPWTSGFELFALSGAAFVLAGSGRGQTTSGAIDRLLRSGRYLFAISLVVFGTQHFRYYLFIAGLVPAWIPARLFWALFTGTAFFAAAFSLLSGAQVRLASTLLGTMFFLWVFLLHLPRVVAAPHSSNEWTSAFVALAMCGASWILAGISP